MGSSFNHGERATGAAQATQDHCRKAVTSVQIRPTQPFYGNLDPTSIPDCTGHTSEFCCHVCEKPNRIVWCGWGHFVATCEEHEARP